MSRGTAAHEQKRGRADLLFGSSSPSDVVRQARGEIERSTTVRVALGHLDLVHEILLTKPYRGGAAPRLKQGVVECREVALLPGSRCLENWEITGCGPCHPSGPRQRWRRRPLLADHCCTRLGEPGQPRVRSAGHRGSLTWQP